MIYDCFTFFNEFDLLELRLNILYDYVDYFIISEANRTHSGGYKDFNLEKQLNSRYKKFQDKIIYIKVDDFPSFEDTKKDEHGNRWFYENHQRDAIMQGLKNAKDNDIIIVSDLDEIPNPVAIKKYKEGICSLVQKVFYYSLNTLNIYSPYTKAPKICHYKDLIDPKQKLPYIGFCEFSSYGLPTYLRFCRGKKIKNGGWHFSYLGNAQSLVEKRYAMPEQQYNNANNMSIESMQKAIDEGKDILGRDCRYINIIPKQILPKYVINNIEKYNELISHKNLKPILIWKLKYYFSKIYLVKHKDNDESQKTYKILGIKFKTNQKECKTSK